MKFRWFLGLFLWGCMLFTACSEEIKFDHPVGELAFSAHTIFCDTVFNQVRSETYALKIYNKESHNVLLPEISLKGGSNSLYRINVDGQSGFHFTDIPLRAKDSLYVFIEIAPQSHAPVSIAEDWIQVSDRSGMREVALFSVIEDAEFFISTKDHPVILSEDTDWKADKSKIIFGEVQLAEGKTLTLQRGTKVYFHKNSSLKLNKNSMLKATGEIDRQVVLRGDRHDPRYDTIPANWNGILAEEGARVDFLYTTLMGGTTGLSLKNASAQLKNSVIKTFEKYGIYAENSQIDASNLVMADAGTAVVGLADGGGYNFIHSTLVNFWSNSGGMMADVLHAEDAVSLNIKNSILYSDRNNAIVVGSGTNYTLQNNLFNYDERQAGFPLSATTGSVVNEDPLFINFTLGKLNLRLQDDSPAKSKGDPTAALLVPEDFSGVSRTLNPTLGAYQ